MKYNWIGLLMNHNRRQKMTIEEYNIKQLEKEGMFIKVLSIRKTFIGKRVTICSLGAFELEYYERHEKQR